MNWENHFAQRTQLFRRNTVREFLKYAGQPGMISFAGGLPDPALLPVSEIAAASERIAERFGARTLQYGPSDGIPELRSHIAARFHSPRVLPENVLITNGSQQALDLVGRVLLEEGDRVLVQNPTYLAALSAWSPFGVRFCAAEEEEDLALAYSIPNFQNPSGTTLDQAARGALLQRCATESIPLVEDDAYGELRYEGKPLPSILEMSETTEGPVIHLGTFSKVLAPGLRIGWAIAARELIDKMVQARQAMDIHPSSLTQYLALQLIEDGVMERLVPRLRAVYRSKRDEMLKALSRHMPTGVTWTRPEGGLFILLRLPAALNGRVLAKHALESGVVVVPGEEFHVQGGDETVRLNFSHPSKEEIETGITKLAQSVRHLSL